jgi:(1->4)-alpha-D-glucan 1-alpha-D-glucosylmutase
LLAVPACSRGSRHGYDIVDHGQLNPEIGTREDFDRFVEALRSHAMGQIVDVVPNHMAVMGADNAWWIDVLENGPASTYATYFDIDWYPLDPSLRAKCWCDSWRPLRQRARAGELVLAYEPDAGSFSVNYHTNRFPSTRASIRASSPAQRNCLRRRLAANGRCARGA